jgi:hypothetical protein
MVTIGVLGVRLQVRPRPSPLNSAAFSKIRSPDSANKLAQNTEVLAKSLVGSGIKAYK